MIADNLHRLFPGMEFTEHATFRVTRDADYDISEAAEDLLEAVEQELHARRFGDVVRLEVEADDVGRDAQRDRRRPARAPRPRLPRPPARSTWPTSSRSRRSTGPTCTTGRGRRRRSRA